MRLQEQSKSASLGNYQFEQLSLPGGEIPREGCIDVAPPFLAALWKAIRTFEPDYLFCPPLPNDPLAGVHIDHWAVAEAVRKVAYMINVPHAFTPEYPADETKSVLCKVPVILNTYDGYMSGENAFDLAINVESVFPLIAEQSYCHQSQISEWLPWVARHQLSAPGSMKEWLQTLRQRFERQNREFKMPSVPLCEFFSVTAWGEIPNMGRLKQDFPENLAPDAVIDRLEKRLIRWRREEPGKLE
jgi:LmbE family N-acetylglucosaminyl deacetylase